MAGKRDMRNNVDATDYDDNNDHGHGNHGAL